jgi:hypothetical protein
MAENQGYSGTPLEKKLGITDGMVIKLIDVPDYYFSLFDTFPQNIVFENSPTSKKNFIHAFLTEEKLLDELLNDLKKEIFPNGIIWISWYKKSAKMNSEITEDLIRKIAIENGLVDIKVCAIDQFWSALKLVIPVKNR